MVAPSDVRPAQNGYWETASGVKRITGRKKVAGRVDRAPHRSSRK
jgi:hypothetical protein